MDEIRSPFSGRTVARGSMAAEFVELQLAWRAFWRATGLPALRELVAARLASALDRRSAR